MRIKLNYDKYAEEYYQMDMQGYHHSASCSNSNEFREYIQEVVIEDIKRQYEHRIREKCLKEIIAEKQNLSEVELKLILDERVESFIEIRAVREVEKIVRLKKRIVKTRSFQRDSYIATDSELENKEKNETQKPEVQHILKNGLNVKIEEETTTYQSKDGTLFRIDRTMTPSHERNFSRLELIVRECAESGLHIDWIAKILGVLNPDKRRIVYLAKKLGFNVCTTPRSKYKTAEILRVLDKDGMFIIEKPNPFRVKMETTSENGGVYIGG